MSVLLLQDSLVKTIYFLFSKVIELNFYRFEDSSFFTEKFTLKSNSEKRITIDDFNLNEFIKTEGWITIKADNPYIQGFYFHLNSSGLVSGDHFF